MKKKYDIRGRILTKNWTREAESRKLLSILIESEFEVYSDAS